MPDLPPLHLCQFQSYVRCSSTWASREEVALRTASPHNRKAQIRYLIRDRKDLFIKQTVTCNSIGKIALGIVTSVPDIHSVLSSRSIFSSMGPLSNIAAGLSLATLALSSPTHPLFQRSNGTCGQVLSSIATRNVTENHYPTISAKLAYGKHPCTSCL